MLNCLKRLSNPSLTAVKLECVKTFCCGLVALKLLASGWELEWDPVKVAGLLILTWLWLLSILPVNFASSMIILQVWSSMMTSSNGNISALLALCAGNSPVPVNSPHKGQWRRALMFTLKGWVNNRKAGDLRRNHVHYDVTVMPSKTSVLDLPKNAGRFHYLCWASSWSQ